MARRGRVDIRALREAIFTDEDWEANAVTAALEVLVDREQDLPQDPPEVSEEES